MCKVKKKAPLQIVPFININDFLLQLNVFSLAFNFI